MHLTLKAGVNFEILIFACRITITYFLFNNSTYYLLSHALKNTAIPEPRKPNHPSSSRYHLFVLRIRNLKTLAWRFNFKFTDINNFFSAYSYDGARQCIFKMPTNSNKMLKQSIGRAWTIR